jgi:hypothetical protein
LWLLFDVEAKIHHLDLNNLNHHLSPHHYFACLHYQNTTKMIYNTLAFALGLISANALLYTQDTVTQDYMWNSFKQEYNKKYSAEEEAHRFQIFLENMKIADKRNEAELSHGGSATHGM